MDNVIYYGGLALKRFIEHSGRTPTAKHYAVALALAVQETGESLEDVVQVILNVREYDPKANRMDEDARIRQLMGY